MCTHVQYTGHLAFTERFHSYRSLSVGILFKYEWHLINVPEVCTLWFQAIHQCGASLKQRRWRWSCILPVVCPAIHSDSTARTARWSSCRLARHWSRSAASDRNDSNQCACANMATWLRTPPYALIALSCRSRATYRYKFDKNKQHCVDFY